MTSPKPTDYVLQVAGAPYAVIAMERTATSDIVVTVRAGASPWLGAGAYTATLRRKDHSAAYTGTYAVIDYHVGDVDITIKGIFHRQAD